MQLTRSSIDAELMAVVNAARRRAVGDVRSP